MANVTVRLNKECDVKIVLEMSEGVFGGNDNFVDEFLNNLNDPNQKMPCKR